MKKYYGVFADWGADDIAFLKTLDLPIEPQQGYFNFLVEKDTRSYRQILDRYQSSFKSIFLPNEFSITFSFAQFSKEDLDNASYYQVSIEDGSLRFPEPKSGFPQSVYSSTCASEYCLNNKVQHSPFIVKVPKPSNDRKYFTINKSDVVFFTREFYENHLVSWGFDCRDVIDKKTGKVSKEYIQLEIPLAKSHLQILGSDFEQGRKKCNSCGDYIYMPTVWGYFPKFKNDFEFSMCRTQEHTDRGTSWLVISKDFCQFLVRHGIIDYETGFLTPTEN